MKKYLIYLHKNKINNKFYVGQTCQKPSERWGHDGINYQSQPLFYNAILKYGWDNFEHIILEEGLTAQQANERECFWGGYYHSIAPEGYNLVLGSNKQHSTSTNLHNSLSEAIKKTWEKEEYRQKVIEGRKKMWQQATPEIKEKMLANLDRSGKGWKSKQKQVLCIETGIIYPSLREAERQTGISHCNISQVCIGKRKTAGKYHWKYI